MKFIIHNLKIKKFKKGLTLIELIIYIGIVGIVLIAMVDLSIRLVYSQAKNVSASEVQQNMRYVLERMTSSIENAKELNSDTGNTLDLTVGGETIVYRLNNGAIEASRNGGDFLPLTSDKVTVSTGSGNFFTKLTNDTAISVKITFDIFETRDINQKQTVSTAVLLRGK